MTISNTVIQFQPNGLTQNSKIKSSKIHLLQETHLIRQIQIRSFRQFMLKFSLHEFVTIAFLILILTIRKAHLAELAGIASVAFAHKPRSYLCDFCHLSHRRRVKVTAGGGLKKGDNFLLYPPWNEQRVYIRKWMVGMPAFWGMANFQVLLQWVSGSVVWKGESTNFQLPQKWYIYIYIYIHGYPPEV